MAYTRKKKIDWDLEDRKRLAAKNRRRRYLKWGEFPPGESGRKSGEKTQDQSVAEPGASDLVSLETK